MTDNVDKNNGGFDATLKPGLRTNNAEAGSATVDPKVAEKPVKDIAAAVAEKVRNAPEPETRPEPKIEVKVEDKP